MGAILRRPRRGPEGLRARLSLRVDDGGIGRLRVGGEGTYDGVLMMAAISDAQGRALTTLLNSDRCSSFVANGAPGFNVGCSAASIGLTRTMRRAGLVEDSSEAHTTPCTLEGRIPGYTTPLYAD